MPRESHVTKASDGRSYPFWVRTTAPNLGEGGTQAWLRLQRLSKGDTYSLPVFVKELQLGLRWDGGTDVDCSVALFDERMRNVGHVSYRRLVSACGSIVHSGDNRTGAGDGDDETININLATLPTNIHYLVLVVTVFTSDTNFNQVENLEVEMRYGNVPEKGDELFTISLGDLAHQAMLVGQLIRNGPTWTFTALAEETRGQNIAEVLKNGAIEELLPRFPSIAVVVRRISVCVLEGNNLVAKDISFFGRKATSDPYYILKFQGQKTQSEVQKQTLNPVWSRRLIELGSVKEGETDLLEITLYDRDLINSDDFMGVVRVPAGKLYALGVGEYKFWFKLNESDEKRYRNETVSGEILVEISVKAPDVSRRSL